MVILSERPKTILFHPLNSPGHINPMVALADVLKYEYGHKCVFLVMGSMIGNTLAEHGHELVCLEEANPMEFYELKNFEDPEANDREAEARGELKQKVTGCQVWPQMIVRNSHMFKLAPIEALLESLTIMEKSMVSIIRDNHAQIERTIYEQIKPHLIVIDAYFIPPCIIKRHLQVPWMRIYSANPIMLTQSKLADGIKPLASCGFSLKTKRERDLMRRHKPQEWFAMLDEWRAAQLRMRDAMTQADAGGLITLLRQFDCPPPPQGQMTHDSPHLNFHTYPKHLDYDQDDDLFAYKEREFRLDSLIRSPFGKKIAPQAIANWEHKFKEAGGFSKQVVFLSLGSIASGQVSLMKKLIKICSPDSSRLYVVSKGVFGDHFELASNMIGANFVPQTFFLEKCHLAIVHGGNNTINECCYYGKPMIVLPVFSDQLDNAQRIEDLALGKRLNLWSDESLESDLIRSIDELLSQADLLDKCRQIGDQMKARDEPRKAAFMMDKLARERNLELDFLELCRDRDLPQIKAKLNTLLA